MKSLTGKFSSARGWALLLLLFLGAGLVVAACGEEDTPAPTTPAPPPAPTPTPTPPPAPEPDPPATPEGLRITATGMDFIEWKWNPVEAVSGYDVQFSANEAFTTEDEIIARTAEEISYRKDGLEPEASGYLRVRSATGTGEDRITSGWSTHVTGMTMAAAPPEPPAPTAPATPTGLTVSDETESTITWTWNAVAGVQGYVVQVSTDETFEDMFEGDDSYSVTTDTSYTATQLNPETSVYVRVAAAALKAATPSLNPADYVLSAWTTHATGTTGAAARQTPPAPANLRLKEGGKGSDFLEWEWDEVPGADGYESEFSLNGTDFTAQVPHRGRSATSRRVSNLGANTRGYLRVRSYTGSGTGADTVRGDWSASDRQTTGEPPPPEPLSAPRNVRSTAQSRDSITLAWEEVSGAGSYEVEQQTEGGSWTEANCGSATDDNVVTGTSCVASGLSVGTSYDFRVKARPVGSDNTESGWSGTASARTSGQAPPPPISGGGGDLNVQWTSNGSSVTWNWDPVEDRTNRQRIEHLVYVTASATCGTATYVAPGDSVTNQLADDNSGTTWTNIGQNISARRTNLEAGATRTFCVVRTWKDDLGGGVNVQRFGTPSVVAAATAPSVPDSQPSPVHHPTTRLTTRVAWSYNMDPDFDYPGRLVSVRRSGSAPTHASCSDGDTVPSKRRVTTTDVTETHTVSNPDAYSFYRFCVRAENASGRSSWVSVGGDNANIVTRPAAPSQPKYDSTESAVTRHAWGGDNVTRIAWSVEEKADTPRRFGEYDFKAFRSTQSSISTNAVQAVCETPSAENVAGYSEVSVQARDRGTGIEIYSGTDSLGSAADEYFFYNCVRANPTGGSDDHGAWAISRGQRFIGANAQPGAPSGLAVAGDRTTTSRLRWSWTSVSGASGYEVEWAKGSSTAGGTVSTVEAPSSGNPYFERTGLTSSTQYSLRVRQYRTVSGRRLSGAWASAVSGTTN